jgi:hypothetical protein
MSRRILANEATAARRRVYWHLVGADGISPDVDEATGQPEISTDGAAFTATGIDTLTHIGHGRYFATLSQTAVATDGSHIETRYVTADGVEIPGDSVDVAAFPGYGTAATLQAAAASAVYAGSVTGAATATTLTDSALYGDDDNWKGRVVLFLTGALKGQGTDVTGYASATKTLTFTATTQAAGAGDSYVIV